MFFCGTCGKKRKGYGCTSCVMAAADNLKQRQALPCGRTSCSATDEDALIRAYKHITRNCGTYALHFLSCAHHEEDVDGHSILEVIHGRVVMECFS